MPSDVADVPGHRRGLPKETALQIASAAARPVPGQCDLAELSAENCTT